jgi:WD40 repeat protein
VTSLAFHPEHRRSLLTTAWDGDLKLFDVASGTAQMVIHGSEEGYLNKQENTRACFSPDGRFVCSGDNNGRVFFWDLRNTSKPYAKQITCPSARARSVAPGQAAVVCVDWNPNGRQVCSVDKMGNLCLYIPATQTDVTPE